MSDSVKVSRCMRNQSWTILWHAIPMSRRVRNGINMVSVRNVVDVGRGVRNESWTSVPMVDWTKRCMRHSVDMGGRMRNRVNMIPVSNVIQMRRRMWHVVEMGVLVVALCVCKLSGSKDCDCCQNKCARLKHLILPERIAFQLRAALAAVRCLRWQLNGPIATTVPLTAFANNTRKTWVLCCLLLYSFPRCVFNSM